MKLRVYIETSVISYLTNRPALDVITAGHQATTYKWWEDERSKYELFVSQFVIDEARSGDPVAAQKRIASLAGLTKPFTAWIFCSLGTLNILQTAR
jgi:hypothetical protein